MLSKKPTLTLGTRLASMAAQAMKTHEVVPDVIDKAPEAVAKVTYAKDLAVDIGKVLTPTQVKDPPTVQWDGDNSNYYTLCMTGEAKTIFTNIYNLIFTSALSS